MTLAAPRPAPLAPLPEELTALLLLSTGVGGTGGGGAATVAAACCREYRTDLGVALLRGPRLRIHPFHLPPQLRPGIEQRLHDHAVTVLRAISSHIKGGGGGRPTFAQGGGSNPDGLPDALAEAKSLLGV